MSGEEEKYALTINGEEAEYTLEELKEMASKGADYTNKTQTLAKEREQVEALAEELKSVKSLADAIKQDPDLAESLIAEYEKKKAKGDVVEEGKKGDDELALLKNKVSEMEKKAAEREAREKQKEQMEKTNRAYVEVDSTMDKVLDELKVESKEKRTVIKNNLWVYVAKPESETGIEAIKKEAAKTLKIISTPGAEEFTAAGEENNVSTGSGTGKGGAQRPPESVRLGTPESKARIKNILERFKK